MTNTTASTLNNLVGTYFYKKGMERLSAKGLLYSFAEKTPLPMGEGTTVRWNGWSNAAAVSVAVSEATNQTSFSLSSRKIEATVAQYGRTTTISDIAEHAAVLEPLKGAMEVLTDCAQRSVEAVMQLAVFKSTIGRNVDGTILSAWMSCVASGFHAGSNGTSSGLAWGFPVVWGSSATQLSAIGSTSVSAAMGVYVIKKAVKQLRAKNAMEFADGNFVLIANSDACSDLSRDPDVKAWFASADRGDQVSETGPVQAKPWMRLVGVTVYSSNCMPRYRATHSCDVSFLFGRGAIGSTEFGTSGKSGYELIIKRPGPNSTDNPMNLYSTASFKITMAAKALNTSSGRVLITTSKP